jgi:lipopolysaccharide transport system permease protein
MDRMNSTTHSPRKSRRISLPTPWAPFQVGWRYRALVLQLARREIEARYRGSLLGLLWAVVQPVLLLAVYTFVFGTIMKLRWTVGSESGGEAIVDVSRGHFALLLFSGLIVFNIFGECTNRAPGLLRDHTSFITKMVFPLEVLPWSMLLVALFNAAIASGVLAFFHILLFGLPPATAWLAPIVVLPTIAIVLGLSWLLSSLGLYIDDTRQAVGLLVTMTLFLSPVFYPLTIVPEAYRALLYANPLTAGIEAVRGAFFFGILPEPTGWLLYFAAGWAVLWGGFAWFVATKRGFADVV